MVNAGQALLKNDVQLGRECMLDRLGGNAVAVGARRAELLDDAKLLDVPGDRRLRGLEARLAQLPEKLLLRFDVMIENELQDLLLSFRLHINTSVCQ